jgi:hypothetical protein
MKMGDRTAIRGGKAMKRWTVLLTLALGLPLSGCTPEFAETGNAPVLMRIVSIATEEGQEGESSAFLNSDVSPVFNDNAVVTVEVIPKNPRLVIDIPFQDVMIERYEVRYFRSDGLTEEGIDVPFTISGGLGVLARVGSETEVAFVLVRHQAKFEPPLSQLRGSFGGESVLSVTAEITLHGRTTAGEALSTRGFVRINFADFAESQ